VPQQEADRPSQLVFSDFFGQVTADIVNHREAQHHHFLQVQAEPAVGCIVSTPSTRVSVGQVVLSAVQWVGARGEGQSCLAPRRRSAYHYAGIQKTASANKHRMAEVRTTKEASEESDSETASTMASDTEQQSYTAPQTSELSLCIPLHQGLDPTGLRDVLSAWAYCASKQLAGFASSLRGTGMAVPLLPLLPIMDQLSGSLPAGLVPLQVSGFDLGGMFQHMWEGLMGSNLSSFAGEEIAGGRISTHVGLLSLTSAVMFIGSIRGLNKMATAQEGNLMGMVATAIGIISVLASPGFNGAHLRFFTTFLLASGIGYSMARAVKMEEMPQMVATFHSFVGLAAVLTGFAGYLGPEDYHFMKAVETFLGTAIGALTFTGSVVAAGKLHGSIPGSPIILENRWLLNGISIGSSVVMGAIFCSSRLYATPLGAASLLLNTLVWSGLGVNMVMPIGGADMPVIVSLLNAFSGLATSAAGFMLSNNLLTITGALVASSGTLLSDIMCRGINRSMTNVLLGGFGTESGAVASGGPGAHLPHQEVGHANFVGWLVNARKVMIVPGYGMAVARCQRRIADIVEVLRKHGVIVHFAIHPVAGRLPGHMNVLLAEADVPYDIVKEMEDVNQDMASYDVAIVIGANDIVNPATQDDPSSPIYGMPAIECWQCKRTVVLKRSMATGYSGVDNPLFYKDNVWMLFGDAHQTCDTVFTLLEERQDEIQGGQAGGLADEPHHEEIEEAAGAYPEASKLVGVIRERRQGERRVSIAPQAVPKLRKMGFGILLESGAGAEAGFSDQEYLKKGGVQVAASAEEVLRQADVILKVNEPMLDEVQQLQGSQTLVGFWNMYGNEELLGALRQSSASVVNLALVPRVSRAQKLDALTSMANIAGYKAVLDAFNQFPRFSRSSVTASGTVPPAKVFIIGAGVAGLSAIATAHALGAKVLANDVRDAAREQVESMGAEFVAINAKGIAGEGSGGYATEMGEDFTRAQLATYARVLKEVDVVISTAMIPNRSAPVIITEEMVASMRPGSVIVDLAASTGGNCALTQKDQTISSPTGVTIIGETNYPATMASQASELIGSNFLALLDTLGGGSSFGGDRWEDPIVRPATIVHMGEARWPPPPPPEPTVLESQGAVDLGADHPAQGPPEPIQPPDSVQELLAFIDLHKEELALGVGAAVILGLGLTVNIPEEEVAHLGYFVLSLLIGHFTVSGVTPALHTPLISVTNAISGIIVVGGMLQLSGPLVSMRVSCALAAVFLSSINIVGGFAVTQRMLEMFKTDGK